MIAVQSKSQVGWEQLFCKGLGHSTAIADYLALYEPFFLGAIVAHLSVTDAANAAVTCARSEPANFTSDMM